MRGKATIVFVLGATLLLAGGVALGVGLSRNDGGQQADGADDLLDDQLERPSSGLFDTSGPDKAVTPTAGSPAEAATAFLDAEVAKDYEESFGYLSQPDRESFVATEAWADTHADLWEITAYRLVPDEAAPDERGTAEVLADVELQAGLDPFIGLVPAQAQLSLSLVEEDGGWRVSFADSLYEPIYLDDATADDVTQEWVTARQSCQPLPAEEQADLLGSPSLADTLCGAEGGIEVGPVETIDRLPDAGPYLNAYGEQVATWARVVRLSGAVEIDAVLAPVGDRWEVIGLTPSTGLPSS